MFRKIIKELKDHAPFTAIGAVSGVFIMVLFRGLSAKASYNIFYLLHPLHVFLSALATTSMYEFYKKCSINKKKCNIFVLVIIGYVGSIGIATLSDSIIPYISEVLLDMPRKELHLGFIEEWWLINPLAIAGIALAYFKPATKVPHYGHVLLSTWASLFHIIMAGGQILSWVYFLAIVIFLFVAVWVPCCVSDIVFPLMFVRNKERIKEC